MGPTLQREGIECNMSAVEYAYYELEFDLNNPYVPNEEEAWKLMVPNIFEDIEEINTCLAIVVHWVVFSNVKRSLVIIQKFFEQLKEDIIAIVSMFSLLL